MRDLVQRLRGASVGVSEPGFKVGISDLLQEAATAIETLQSGPRDRELIYALNDLEWLVCDGRINPDALMLFHQARS